MPNFPDDLLRQQTSHFFDPGVVQKQVPNEQLQLGLFGSLTDMLSGRNVQCKWFLHKNVLASSYRPHCHGGMQLCRRGNYDCIEAAVQELVKFAKELHVWIQRS